MEKGLLPQASVIIPTGYPDRARLAVEALLEQSLPPDMYEIILVAPETYKSLFESIEKIRTVFTENLYPPGRMRNLGAKIACGHLLFFLDDDCIPPGDWLETMISEMNRQSDVAVLGCRVITSNKSFWSECADYAIFSPYQRFKRTLGSLGSAALTVKRDVFHEVAGFDENLTASEDWDFCLRVIRSGRKCLFIPEVEILHQHRRESFSDIMKSAFLSGYRSGLFVQQKYPDKMSWLARSSVFLGRRGLYAFLIFPYSLLLTLNNLRLFFFRDTAVLFYFPFMFLAGISYHFGVWQRLRSDKTGFKFSESC